ncbi:MAG: hypothetical protein ABEH43_07560, partial [Flavobacteriales bacterium]
MKLPLIQFFIILFTFFQIKPAEGQKLKDWLKFGKEAMKEGDYYGASKYYRNALKFEERLDIKYKLAEAYRKFNNYEKAAKY